jgi:hypothetical protein
MQAARHMSLWHVDRGRKIRCITSTKLGNNGKSTTSKPTSLLQSIHLALAPNTAVNNDERL